MYYDPVVDVHHLLPAAGGLTTAFYVAPQVPEDAKRLFDAGRASAGLDRRLDVPLRASRAYPSSLILAREWGLAELEERLVQAIEESYEPSWDRDRDEFTWGMGLDEPHPRGQYNAFLAAAEAAGPGMWTALSAEPLPTCPQVVDVDLPTVALRRARWVDNRLQLGIEPLDEDAQADTSFRVKAPGAGEWRLSGRPEVVDRSTAERVGDDLVLTVPRVRSDVEVLRS